MKRRLREFFSPPEAFAAWGLLAVCPLVRLLTPLKDPDVWWQLAAGREMVARGGFLSTDVFSHTLSGVPWIDCEWLGELVLYGLWRGAGPGGVLALKVFLGLASWGLLVFGLRRGGARGAALFIFSFAGFLVLRPRLQERIELATLVFLPLLILLVEEARRRPAFRAGLPWFAVLVTLVWCNVHPGFIEAVLFLFAAAAGARWAGEEPGFIKALDLTAVACLAATFINPAGPRLWLLFGEVFFQMRGTRTVIHEWIAPSLFSMAPFWVLYAAGAVVVGWAILSGRRAARFWAPPVVVFSLLGSSSARATSLLAFVSLPALAEILRGVPLFFQGEAAAPFRRRAGWFVSAAAAALCLRSLPRPAAGVDLRRFPAGACAFVREKGVKGRMFNVYDDGGYVEWALGPERKVFQDGRYLFHGLLMEQTALLDEARKGNGDRLWADFFTRHGVDYAVVTPPFPGLIFPGSAPFPLRTTNLMFPRDRWALVYWDDAGLVFLKRGAGFDGLIAAHEYHWTWPYNMDQMRYVIGNNRVPRGALLAELDRHAAEAGGTAGERALREMIGAPAGGPS